MLRVQEGKVKDQCNSRTYLRDAFGGFVCRNTATRDGYCGVHHPDAVAKRKAKSEERYAQKSAEWDTQRNAAIRARKLAELAERLIPAIMVDTISTYWVVDGVCQDTLRELYEMRR